MTSALPDVESPRAHPERRSALPLGGNMISNLFDHAKNAAAALGVGGALFGAYASSGLPVPASTVFVEAKVASVVARIDASDQATAKRFDSLNASTLELQRKAIVNQRARLRFEERANRSLHERADPVRRVTLERRATEISDELLELDRDDEGLRHRIEKLRVSIP